MTHFRSLYAGLTVIVLILIVIIIKTADTGSILTDGRKDEIVSHTDESSQNTKEVDQFADRIDAVLNKEENLEGAIAGVSIRSARTGRLMYEHHGDTRLHPASNMKLLTGAAALSVLGPEYRMSTGLLTTGKVEDGILEGDLYIKGKGDPTLTLKTFKTMTQALKQNGITKINGDMIGDDTWYDGERLSQDLNWSDESPYYGAQISALTASPNMDYDAGSIIVNVQPGRVGEVPSVKVIPDTDYVHVKNGAITTQTGSAEDDLIVERDHGTNVIRISGTIPAADGGVYEWISVWNPTKYALNLFKSALNGAGVTVSGVIHTNKTPEDAKLVYTHESKPLNDLLVPFMKLSNNTIGEMLIKEMGRVKNGEGSWDSGLQILEDEMKTMGMDMETIVIRDGSGISHINVIPANELTTLLYKVQDQPWFDTFMQALPVSGQEDRLIGGTLRNRLSEFDVKAKTGTIYGVSTLSGYVDTKSGEPFVFSILLNNLLDDEDGPDIEDRLVEVIARY